VSSVALRDPHAAHRRSLRRSRRRTRRATVGAAALAAAAAVAVPYHGLGLPDLAWAAGAAGAVTASVLRWREDRALRALPVPPRTAIAAAEVGGSAWQLAGQFVARLGARGSTAAPLLSRLDPAARAMSLVVARVGPGGDDTLAEALHAEQALRATAGRLVAVERAAAVAPADARGRLGEGASALRTGLADGITAYERLVAAAGECVAADFPDLLLTRRLADATDKLRGLASGLVETAQITGTYTR
jgi:hypothetical protein